MKPFEKINLQFHSLVVFRNLLNDKVLNKFLVLLESLSENSFEQVNRYSSFVSELFNTSCNFTEYVRDCILDDENFYIAGHKEWTNPNLEETLLNELGILQKISQILSDDIKNRMEYKGFLPAWETSEIDFKIEYLTRISNIEKHGYGIYSKFHMFTVKDGAITPVKFPDTTRLSQLKGYDRERKAVIDNTLALLKGNPAANVLLYGDAGTGKSSTIKAIANEYKDKGLRLIEVKKNQLHDIASIADQISGNCLKFILFIDDLSFSNNGDDFGSLKAILEGSVTPKPSNAAIYATSNRRHLIKESFSEREGDDIHINETIQEMGSLSERFGLQVNFEEPNKEQYLQIIQSLSRENEISMSIEDLNLCAERYALLRGSRSPRIARQLIELLISGNIEFLEM